MKTTTRTPSAQIHPYKRLLPAVMAGVAGLCLAAGCTPSREQTQTAVDSAVAHPQTDNVGIKGEHAHPLKETFKPVDAALLQQAPSRESPVAYKHLQPGGAGIGTVAEMVHIRHASEPVNRENYRHYDDNGVHLAAESPVSTLSIDVDTGSYSNVRRMLNGGRLPVEDAVRVEEMINYFTYSYPSNNDGQPFSVTTEVAETPWNPDSRLLHIGIKGMDIKRDQLPPANLVFLVDVSGSMQSDNKLGLLKSALKLIVNQMRDEDTLALAVYAGASGTVLEPTSGSEKSKILSAIDGLRAGGSTNGAAGIRLAYQLAAQSYDGDGINRILLATDGDFNVGTVNFEQLKDLVEGKRNSGISLTTLGFGNGNYNDHLMEQLADAGNGNYAYIDTLNEAQKILVDQMSSTLKTIAKDVKIQVEFNPAVVAEYRLIGYENRALRREDFNNDKVDAGEIGAGHTITALYEITLNDSNARLLEPLRYSRPVAQDTGHNSLRNEIAMLRLRFKPAEGSTSMLIERPVMKRDMITDSHATSDNFRFSAAVAAFGQLLRGGRYTADYDYGDILELARNARGNDDWGYRGEFIKLVNLAGSLSTPRSIARHDKVSS